MSLRPEVRLGLGANLGQFTLLVVVNAFVGAMIGMERSILPAIAEHEFHLAAHAAVLSFIVAFGISKAFTNYLAWAQLTDPNVIQRMLLLRELDVFLLMGSTMAVAFVGARILRRAGASSLISAERITWSTTRPTRDHVAGSVIFGVGWSVASTCPGPMAAQLG